jgi:hypothetical protein
MSISNVEPMRSPAGAEGYERSRLNAVRHGILSRHLVLPWEDRGEYDDLLESLVAEHAPSGPTEHHLVEELAGIVWRKQRVALAEAAACRSGLHKALDDAWSRSRVVSRALVHLEGAKPIESAGAAIRATPEDTETDLRDLAEDEAMTGRALEVLRRGRANAYDKALAELHEDTVAGWWETLAEDEAESLDKGHHDEDDDAGDREPYQPDAQGLRRFLEEEAMPWYRRRRRELENRRLIRAQAFGEALEPDRLDKLARYEVHLDRKLERILGMLLKLQDLRRTIMPSAA